MRFSTLSARPRDWRLALIAVNVALPELLSPILRLLSGDLRAIWFLATLGLLVALNGWVAVARDARPWAILCILLTVVAGLALGQLSWLRAIPYLPLLIAYTPQA